MVEPTPNVYPLEPMLVVLTTLPTRQSAESLAQTLVGTSCAACVQITGPIQSVYRWQGEVETAEEWGCHIKTRASWFERVRRAIEEHHPYEVPEVVAVRLDRVSPAYLQWLNVELP